VYSTCTLSKRENEQVIQRFLESHAEFSPCDFETENAELNRRINNGMLTILPHIDNTDGFFIAKLKRTVL
jgi:16S rRNA (cytosine967-C5)-methyltransferase